MVKLQLYYSLVILQKGGPIMKIGLKELSAAGVFTAIVCMATLVLKIDIPATQGYFNLGDSMIYVAALLFGPFVGGVAGGLGASLADIMTGALWYAPGTLAIKAVEGVIVGYLMQRFHKTVEVTSKWKWLTVLIGIGLGGLIYCLGSTYYIGIFASILAERLFWAVIAILTGAFLVYFGLRLQQPLISWHVLSVLCGGAEMILGYYLYETLLLPYILPLFMPVWTIYALVEVPFNVGQAVIGLIIALPIVRTVSHAFPSLETSRSSDKQAV